MNYRIYYMDRNSLRIRLSGILISLILPAIITISFLFLNGCHIKNNNNNDTGFKTELDLKGEWKFSIGDLFQFVDDPATAFELLKTGLAEYAAQHDAPEMPAISKSVNPQTPGVG